MMTDDTLLKPTRAEWDEWARAEDLRPDHPVVRYLARNEPRPWDAYDSYDAYVRAEVEAGLADVAAGRIVSNEVVQEESRVWRERMLKKLASER